MAIKTYKPYTHSRRNMTGSDFAEITKKSPEKSLTVRVKNTAGRNSYGKITVRHHGGGHKTIYRIIDFKRNKDEIAATVVGIEYDPNRSANIALLAYADGEKRYILAPEGLKAGDVVMSGENVEIKIGNCLPLKNIPIGSNIHNIELKPGKGGQMVRAAGNVAQLMAKEGKFAQVRLPSGEVRMIRMECRATIGEVGNGEHGNIQFFRRINHIPHVLEGIPRRQAEHERDLLPRRSGFPYGHLRRRHGSRKDPEGSGSKGRP